MSGFLEGQLASITAGLKRGGHEMSTKSLGGIVSNGKPAIVGVALTLIIAGLTVAAMVGPGVEPNTHTGLFELGPAQAADILGDPAIPGPDWADVFDANGAVKDMAGGVAAAFMEDDLSPGGAVDRTTFSGAGGSNKNSDPISAWHWDSGSVPAKDDLSNSYAWAATKLVGGQAHLFVYAGFERIEESGDSHVDIEFFQDDVTIDEEIPCDDPGNDITPCGFIGSRTSGDIIVSMDFLNGGGFGTMSVRKWSGTAYVQVGTRNGEGCNPADTICGFNNGGLIDGGPWPNYERHGYEVQMLPKNAFTEFGIDVTAVLGGTPCLTTVMGKTRSSQSFTAELKDFSGPVAFPVCAIKWHKVDNVAKPLGGATFQFCRTHSYNPQTGGYTDIQDECRTVPDNIDGDIDPADVDMDGRPGEFEVGSLLLGRYKLWETMPPPGWGMDPDVVTIDFTGGELQLEVREPFVDGRPIVKITAFGYTNTPTGTPVAGVVSGTTVYTLRLKNYGTAVASLSGSLTVTVTAQGAGTFSCAGTGVTSCKLSWSGVALAPGTEVMYTLTITYVNFADGAQVTADLASTYTTPPDSTVVRQASGSPAVIVFTAQGD